MRLLIVEDEKDLRDILEKRLQKEYSVDACGDGEQAWDYISVYTYDIIILDIMLPKIDGITLLKRIRQSGRSVPVLLLTAKSSVEERVAGLDAGADDYLVKPFAFEELQARIRVMMRRTGEQVSNQLVAGSLVMDTLTRTVTRAGRTITLSMKEYMLLEYMMRNQNMTLTRGQLEQCGWNSSFEGSSNIIDVYIRYLRRKIDDDFTYKMIQTVRGSGYRLQAEEDA